MKSLFIIMSQIKMQMKGKIFLIIGIFFVSLIGFNQASAEPYMIEPNFIIEEYVSGLHFPTTMVFMEDDIIVLEKFTGYVRLVKDGQLQEEPLLKLKVDQNTENGLLGITALDSKVYIYFTEVQTAEPIVPGKTLPREQVLGNRVYKYNWDGKNLSEGTLVKDLPVDLSKVAFHAGGAMATGLDGTVYAVIGDTMRQGILQNLEIGSFEDAGVILKVNHDESVLRPSETKNPQEHYFGMGIRNSFGLAIDPITGFLWDTENGPNDFDEVNLVESKFNSGWMKIMGPATEKQIKNLPRHGFEYSDPEFSWEQTVALTGLVFVNSELFNDYNDILLVGDWVSGSIYKFKLNSERTQFVFNDPGLKDLVLNAEDLLDEIIFASGFNGVTDLHFGPDGLLYVLSIGDGVIYRISPKDGTEELSKIIIPKWVKNNSGWWSEGLISDSDFVLGIQYLFTERIIIIPLTEIKTTPSQHIPEWIRNNSGWWAEGSISDLDFVSGMQYLISNGIIKFNLNRCDILELRADLSECKLSGIDFSNSDLKMVNFKDADLRNANLSNSDLRSSFFNEANLIGADFSHSKLQMANFKDAVLTNSKFEKSVLNFVEMSGANLEGAKMFNSNIERANLSNVNLKDADLSQTSLRFTRLNNAIISGADLSKTDLFAAHFENSDLSKANFSETKFQVGNLMNAIIKNADLSYSNFAGTNLENADLSGANLTKANFPTVNLKNAKIKNADLSYSSLDGANLESTDLTQTILIRTFMRNTNLTNTDFTNADLKFANIRFSNLTNTKFLNADLMGATLLKANILGSSIFINANLLDAELRGTTIAGADFTGAILVNADFTGAILDNVDFSGADLTNTDFRTTKMTNVNFEATNLEKAIGLPFSGCIGHQLCIGN